VTSQQRGSTTKSTAYDAQDRLLHWSSTTNSQQEWYLYDATGERVLRRSFDGTNTTLTVYAFGLEEHQYAYSGSGSSATNTSNTYYYDLAGRLLGTWDGSASPTLFLLTDSLGSVVSSFNNLLSGAATLGNQLYDPYGNQRLKQGSLSTSKGFTGLDNDGLTGLDYYNARYYDPTIGVFLSADRVQGNSKGMDPYAYVGGNPETKTDPTGHDASPWYEQAWDWITSHPIVMVTTAAVVFSPAGMAALVLIASNVVILESPPARPRPYSVQPEPAPTPTSPTPTATPQPATGGAGARKGNNNNSPSEQYIRAHLSSIIPLAGKIADSGFSTKVEVPGQGGTDIDLETEHMVISVGTWGKFYNQKTGQYDQKLADNFWSEIQKYSAYAANIGKEFIFAYDTRWSSLDIPDKVLRTLNKKGIPVVRFHSGQ
jgi:RHS repeat-associated protein